MLRKISVLKMEIVPNGVQLGIARDIVEVLNLKDDEFTTKYREHINNLTDFAQVLTEDIMKVMSEEEENEDYEEITRLLESVEELGELKGILEKMESIIKKHSK